jgi:putative OPT family oligopeptide transporter
MVGLVGSSNNPVSGMTIATLLFATIILKATGTTGHEGMLGAISIGAIICIIAAIAGDTSQDLKTGYELGATPSLQQYGQIFGVIASALAIGGTLYLLNAAWGFGSTELPAPQATLMKMVVEGVMGGNLPWTLVFVGAGIAIAIEIIGIPVLPFAVGLYLPIHLSTGIMVGGLVRLFFDKKKGLSDEKRKDIVDKGVLFSSGLIAGEGLVGILLAVFAIIPVGAGVFLGDVINISSKVSLGNIGGLVFYALLVLILFKFTIWHKDKSK